MRISSPERLRLGRAADLGDLRTLAVDGSVLVGGVRVGALAVQLQHQTRTRALADGAAVAIGKSAGRGIADEHIRGDQHNITGDNVLDGRFHDFAPLK
jgi:hypothetical protein